MEILRFFSFSGMEDFHRVPVYYKFSTIHNIVMEIPLGIQESRVTNLSQNSKYCKRGSP